MHEQMASPKLLHLYHQMICTQPVIQVWIQHPLQQLGQLHAELWILHVWLQHGVNELRLLGPVIVLGLHSNA